MIWQVISSGENFGKMNAGAYNAPELEWGFSSSPIIYKNKVILQCDFLGGGFLGSLDINTGTPDEGELSNESIVWSIKRGGAYMQTPLIYGNYLYHLQTNGSLLIFKANTGEYYE